MFYLMYSSANLPCRLHSLYTYLSMFLLSPLFFFAYEYAFAFFCSLVSLIDVRDGA